MREEGAKREGKIDGRVEIAIFTLFANHKVTLISNLGWAWASAQL
jgi:hypothetical protein